VQCRICATTLPPDARYCLQCGASTDAAATGATQRLDAYSETSMKDGRCPKCGSFAVYYQPQGLRASGHQTGIAEVGLGEGPWGISLAPMVCTDCGYVELYVLYTKDLPHIAHKWRKLPV
jgi:predicted nucleic-acid-binding Zn-ribbon protein